MVLFFIALAVFRLSLISKGHLFYSDEFRYFQAFSAWHHFLHGKIIDGIGCFFKVYARPGFVLVSLVPAGLQLFLAHWVKIPNSAVLSFFDLPSFFNVLITLTSSVVFYRIASLLTVRRGVAAAGTVVYSMLVNSNLYIRHMSPYDYSLLCFLIAIYVMLSRQHSGSCDWRSAAFCGFLCGLGFLIYPGYYALVAIVALCLAALARFDLKVLAAYIVSLMGPILGMQALSLMVGASYFSDCRYVSSMINHGSFEEGFLFIVRYMHDVEGAAGAALLALALVYFCFIWARDGQASRWLLASAALMFGFHAVEGVVFHRMVFYGRLLHMYFPFVVLAAVRALDVIDQETWRKAAVCLWLAVSVVSFVPFAMAYSRLVYPGDLYFKYLAGFPVKRVLFTVSGEGIDPAQYKRYSVVAENLLSYFDVQPGWAPTPVPEHMELLAVAPNPLEFPSYTFEEYTPAERRLLRQRKYPMMIFVDPQARPLLNRDATPILETFLNREHGRKTFTP